MKLHTPWNIFSPGGQPIHKDQQPSDSGWHQKTGVKPKPGEIQGDLDSVVIPDAIQRLEFEHLGKGGPFFVEQVAGAAFAVDGALEKSNYQWDYL